MGSPPASVIKSESDSEDGGIETSCGPCRGTSAFEFVVSIGTNAFEFEVSIGINGFEFWSLHRD